MLNGFGQSRMRPGLTSPLLMGAGSRVVWLLAGVPGFRLVLARGWHEQHCIRGTQGSSEKLESRSSRRLREAPVHRSATAIATIAGRMALFAAAITVAACTQQASGSGKASHAVKSPASHPAAPVAAITPVSVATCYHDGSKTFCEWGPSWSQLIQAQPSKLATRHP